MPDRHYPGIKPLGMFGTVLRYLKSIEDITLLQLSCRLCILFLLVSAQRCQTIHLIELGDIELSDASLVIQTNHMLKQTRPGSHLDTMSFKRYQKDSKLCIVRTMEDSLEHIEHLRQGEKLIISTMRPIKLLHKLLLADGLNLLYLRQG